MAGVVLAGVAFTVRDRTADNSQDSGADEKTTTSENITDLSRKNLSEFPKQVLSNESVTELNLSYNSLTGALPAEIRKLKNLETLDVSHNNMTGIPAEIGQLGSLRILNYSYNEITGLPMELGNLTKLEQLDLRGNDVSQTDLQTIKQKLTSTTILTD